MCTNRFEISSTSLQFWLMCDLCVWRRFWTYWLPLPIVYFWFFSLSNSTWNQCHHLHRVITVRSISRLSLSLSLRRKLTARFHRVWKSRRENPAELFPFSLVLVWLFITATLFHPHFGELKNTFLSPILSCRPSNRLSSVWWCRCQCRATSSNKTAKVIYCF